MNIGLIGKKVVMTSLFRNSGEEVPATVIEAGPCTVVQLKMKDRDGYEALQVGFQTAKKSPKKPQLGHFKKYEIAPMRVLREFRVGSVSDYKSGQELKVDMFAPGDLVDVTGVSKGKGFTGVMKRWGFHGGPGSHGTHKWHRRPGSISSSAWPSRVFKGKRMAGHDGADRVTMKNLEVLEVDKEKNLLFVKGAVSGAYGGYLLIIKSGKKRRVPQVPKRPPEKAKAEVKKREKAEEKKPAGEKKKVQQPAKEKKAEAPKA